MQKTNHTVWDILCPTVFYKSPCPFGVGKTYLLTRFISDNYVFSYGYLPLLSSCIRLCAVFCYGCRPRFNYNTASAFWQPSISYNLFIIFWHISQIHILIIRKWNHILQNICYHELREIFHFVGKNVLTSGFWCDILQTYYYERRQAICSYISIYQHSEQNMCHHIRKSCCLPILRTSDSVYALNRRISCMGSAAFCFYAQILPEVDKSGYICQK